MTSEQQKKNLFVRSLSVLQGKAAYQLVYDFILFLIYVGFIFIFASVAVPLYAEAEPILQSVTEGSLSQEELGPELMDQLSALESPEIVQSLFYLRLIVFGFLIGFPILFALFKYLIWTNMYTKPFRWSEFGGFVGLTFFGFLMITVVYMVVGSIVQQQLIGFVLVLVMIPLAMHYMASLYHSLFYRETWYEQEDYPKWQKARIKAIEKRKSLPHWVRTSVLSVITLAKRFQIIHSHAMQYFSSAKRFGIPFVIKLLIGALVYIMIGFIQYIPNGPTRQVLTFLLILLFIAWIRYYSYLIVQERLWDPSRA